MHSSSLPAVLKPTSSDSGKHHGNNRDADGHCGGRKRSGKTEGAGLRKDDQLLRIAFAQGGIRFSAYAHDDVLRLCLTQKRDRRRRVGTVERDLILSWVHRHHRAELQLLLHCFQLLSVEVLRGGLRRRLRIDDLHEAGTRLLVTTATVGV